MSESECRHLPESAYNPERCPKCVALLRRSAMTQADASRRKNDASEPVDARLLAAAKAFLAKFRGCGSDEARGLHAAIADAERTLAWTGERPTVPGWYWFSKFGRKPLLVQISKWDHCKELCTDWDGGAPVSDDVFDHGQWQPANIAPPPAPGGGEL